ncbi:uncharacterized protein [Asterias amurensis]|uniref:uncharacterized protein n=1 Tax=Asterias amurensis TaxID=7602 RepID=UPI003AB56652
MELTAPRFLLAAIPAFLFVLVTTPSASEAQRIVSFPSITSEEETSKDFPRRKELLQALDFLEEYGRGRENDWNDGGELQRDDGAFYGDDDDQTDILYPDANEIYPALDFADNLRQPDEVSVEEVDNEIDDFPWMGEDERYAGQELTEEQERLEDMLHNYDYEELLKIAEQEEEIEEDEALRDALEKEEEDILDVVEEEMEYIAVDNILEDIWAEEELQKDAEDQLKWLLQEEEEKEFRDEEDPFEYFYPDEAAEPSDIDDVMGQDDTFPGDVDEGMESAYADYSEGISVDYTGESFDEEEEEEEEEGEELLEEAAEILDLAEQGYEEDNDEKKLLAEQLLQDIIGKLTEDDVGQEEDYAPSYAGEEEEEESILDAGMVDEEIEYDVREKEEEVYDDLLELVDQEIDKVIENIADDIMLELEDEEKEGLETGDSSEGTEAGDYEGEELDGTSLETSVAEEEESVDETPEGSVFDLDEGEECPSLQYFIDDCNIVNNYVDLGADGYKDLFTGACNRHQLCYTCGSYYDVDAKLCDELFKAEILSRCPSKDTDCKQRAKYFWLVARNNRIHVPDSPSVCGDPCLLEFLVEV